MIRTSHSRRLRDKIRLARYPLECAAGALWTHPRLADLYPEFLFATHCIIRASVPLMQAAADRCRTGMAADSLAAGMYRYLTEHIPEEMNHDEWVLEDLGVLGFHREEVLNRIPPATAAALAGAQYYWIQHVHAAALLGYIAVLEGTPPEMAFFDRAADCAGIPRAAFRNLRRHSLLDPRHRDEFDRVLDRLPLTEDHHALVGVSAFQTIHLLTNVLQEIVASAERPELRGGIL